MQQADKIRSVCSSDAWLSPALPSCQSTRGTHERTGTHARTLTAALGQMAALLGRLVSVGCFNMGDLDTIQGVLEILATKVPANKRFTCDEYLLWSNFKSTGATTFFRPRIAVSAHSCLCCRPGRGIKLSCSCVGLEKALCVLGHCLSMLMLDFTRHEGRSHMSPPSTARCSAF